MKSSGSEFVKCMLVQGLFSPSAPVKSLAAFEAFSALNIFNETLLHSETV